MNTNSIQDATLFMFFVQSTWTMFEIDTFAIKLLQTKQRIIPQPNLSSRSTPLTSNSNSAPLTSKSNSNSKSVRIENKKTRILQQPRKTDGYACKYHHDKHMRCPENCKLGDRKPKPKIPKHVYVKNKRTGKFHKEYIVDTILNHRFLPDGNLEFYVSWLGYSSSENSWEPHECFIKSNGNQTIQLTKYMKQHHLC